MKLDRNIPDNDGRGKYAIIKLRALEDCRSDETFHTYSPEIERALKTLQAVGALDWGENGTESEFFLIRLKDKYAQPALYAYAEAAVADDAEYANEIVDMAKRSGRASPWCKRPD
jgi:hypothetical protein